MASNFSAPIGCWDVSSMTAFFAFRLSHFVLIETSWKLEICSLRFECLDGSLFGKTPAHCTLWGDSGWRNWVLPLWKCVTWISIAHNLTSAISRPFSSKSTPNYLHVAAALLPDIIYGPHSDCQRQLYFTRRLVGINIDCGEKGRSHDIDWERERPCTGMCWGPAKKGD